MDSRIEAIKNDIQAANTKLDALMAGQSRNNGFLIERLIGELEDKIRYELPEIEKAIA